MKRIVPSILLGIMVAFAACSKKDDSPPPNPPLEMKANVTGIPNWSSPLAIASITYDLTANTQTLQVIGSYHMPDPYNMDFGLKIELDSFYGIGDYPITETSQAKAWFVVSTIQIPAKTGTVHVKNYSISQTSGNFSFATDTLSAQDGTFNLHVQ